MKILEKPGYQAMVTGLFSFSANNDKIVGMHGYRSLALLTVILGAGPAGAQVQTQFDLEKECFNDSDQGMFDAGGGAAAKYNPKCDHQKMLQEANDILILSELYSEARFSELVKGAGGDPTNPATYTGTTSTVAMKSIFMKDGTCLVDSAKSSPGPSGTLVAAEDIKVCIKRVLRLKLDAELRRRDGTLRNNRAREDLISTSGSARLIDANGATVSQDSKILKNFIQVDVSTGKNLTAGLQKLSGTQTVQFNAKDVGGGIEKAAGAGASGDPSVVKVKAGEDLKSINKDAGGLSDLDNNVEVAAVDKDGRIVEEAGSLQNGIKSVAKKTGAKIADDRNTLTKMDGKQVRQLLGLNAVPSCAGCISELAFANMMTQLRDAAKKKLGNSPAANNPKAVDDVLMRDGLKLQVSIPSAPTGPKPAGSTGASGGGGSTDQSILDGLKADPFN